MRRQIIIIFFLSRNVKIKRSDIKKVKEEEAPKHEPGGGTRGQGRDGGAMERISLKSIEKSKMSAESWKEGDDRKG